MKNPASDGASAPSVLSAAPARAAVAVIAARLAEALADRDVMFVAVDEQRADGVARILTALAPDADVVHYPSSDALPGDSAPPSLANAGHRMAALRRLRMRDGRTALITTAEAATRPTPPPSAFDAAPPSLAVGDTIDLGTVEAMFEGVGYVVDDRVDEPGEVAVRGQVVDIFPADADGPVRIEVEDGRIVAVRQYDAVTQLGIATLDRIEAGHATEPGGAATPLFEHLAGFALALDEGIDARRQRFLALVADAAKRPGARIEAAVDDAAWAAALAGRERIEISAGDTAETPRFVERRGPAAAAARLAKATLTDGGRVILAGGVRDLRFLASKFAAAIGVEAVAATGWVEASAAKFATLNAPIDRGWSEPGRLVIAAADLLGSRARVDEAGTSGDIMPGLGEVSIGDVVVHEDHGIAVVAGLEALPGDGGGDAVILEHAGGGRRLVPVEASDRIWRYGADRDAVTLDGLDGASWAKRRGDIDATIAESARALTALAAERAQRTTAVIDPDAAAYERSAAGFPFTETPDQARAIAAVRVDLASGKPMDRLVIGDVGYGKTEVALRAAALTALAGRQVIVAAPTTVLVRQHLESFRRRFEGTGIAVAGLSRLSSPAEKKAAKAGLADGSINIVIGTAAVAAKGVAYADLGLVVIDEEQRFGTADKAKLRALTDGHVLTLSATPIPRTLQTALVGLQQLSVIATPPARRQPIRTSLADFDAGVLRTALLREKGRGGQSFVVVPRIDDMAAMAARLAEIAPELTTVEAHGKLAPADIDAAMVGFANGDGDVLLATNIIEAGLDVPRANTMIVWRADMFGLSQLHQLRGRVGRGGRRGQIYLLTDPANPIAEATLKRLRTLQAFDRLGAGFQISARDLDMRGAGDLLGEAQAGHMKLIGIDLYQHLLELSLRAARGETVDHWLPELRVGSSGRLPEDWIPETEIRLALYMRLARLTELGELDAFEAELEDRFGTLPEAAATLVAVARVRLLACPALIARIDAGPAAIALTPRTGFAGDAAAAGLEAKGDRLLLREAIDDPAARLARVRAVLEALGD